jgi:ABC-2 type transport system permease protein
MIKYFALLKAFLKVSLIADLEFRLNITIKIITDLIWYAAQISVFEVLFYHTPHLAEWDLPATRLFLSVLFLVDSCWMFFVSENLDRLSLKVRNGDLDMLLTKPVNSQFMISMQKFSSAFLINMVLTFALVNWALTKTSAGWHLSSVLWIIYFIPWALLVVYGTRFLFSALSVIFINADSVSYIWYQLYRMGTRPDSIYPKWLRYTLLSIVPMGFVASVPSRLLLGIYSAWMVVALPAVGLGLLYLSHRFWHFTLRHYSSASS